MDVVWNFSLEHWKDLLVNVAAALLIAGFVWLMRKGKSALEDVKAAITEIVLLHREVSHYLKGNESVNVRKSFLLATQLQLDHLRDVRDSHQSDIKEFQWQALLTLIIIIPGIFVANDGWALYVFFLFFAFNVFNCLRLSAKLSFLNVKITKVSGALASIALEDHKRFLDPKKKKAEEI